MNQQLMIKASLLERQAKEEEQRLTLVETEIEELTKFNMGLNSLISSEENEMLSSLGKGVLVKTEIKDKKLFVNVGANVIVRKKPEEVREVVDLQIKRLNEARIYLIERTEITNNDLLETLDEMKEGEEEHECKCENGEVCDSEECECDEGNCKCERHQKRN